MAYPTNYAVTYSYTGFAASQGDNSFPGTQLDADLAGLDAGIDSISAFIKTTLRADGRLNNEVVTYDTLSPPLKKILAELPSLASLKGDQGIPGPVGPPGPTGEVYPPVLPQGRLTLDPGVRVMRASYASNTAVYYVPCSGDTFPVYDGTNLRAKLFGPLGIGLGSNWPANTNFDVFGIEDPTGAIARIVTGPGWASSNAPGAARGTGPGTTELVDVRGMWWNKYAMVSRYENASTLTVPAERAVYLGTIRTGEVGQVNFVYGAVGAGGVAANFGVWNMYNRAPHSTFIGDTTNSWIWASIGWRVANGQVNTMRFNAVRGFDEDPVSVRYTSLGYATAGVVAAVGIGVNTTGTPSQSSLSNNDTISAKAVPAEFDGLIGLGYGYVVPIEYNSSTNDAVWLGDGGLSYVQTGMKVGFWA